MAVPKKRTSKQRKLKRRTHHMVAVPTLVKCSHCGGTCRPHHACSKCGYYDGRAVSVVHEN